MKDVMKVFFLIAGSILFYVFLYFLIGIHPLLLAMIAIVMSVAVIIGGIKILSRNPKLSHRLPRDKEKEYNRQYKEQWKHHTS